MTTVSATWLASTNNSVHFAACTLRPSPVPRQSNLGRNRNPAARANGTSASACSATPAVVPIPSSRTCSAVMSSTRPGATISPRYAANIATRTTLLSTGVHIIAPNFSRALRTCP